MAKRYRVGRFRKFINTLATGRILKGKGDPAWYLLTTVGRKSRKKRTTPIAVESDGEQRWLVSPYGNVGWVHNIRASRKATLLRGEEFEKIRVTELSPEEAAPVLKRYLLSEPIVRAFFDVKPKSPLEDFVAEAPRHPVFRIVS